MLNISGMRILTKSKSLTNYQPFVNNSPTARRVRQRSANIRVLVSQKQQDSDLQKNYMLSRGKENPCSHCTIKQMRQEPKAQKQREPLPTGLV